ncbi:hypothetical protein AMEX_G16386 [Astyanax mexicanus]|uniref:C2H2-type domain-containing protein n=1 Tax=Astyanax mexicanus TaxID=7994 RepID=A0A8T2LKI2_ASTMX|nr:hypothetical protein AMEX_G16386 [Astyanax mexicanus]
MLKAFLLIAVVVVELCGTVWCTMEYSRNMHITIQEGRAMPKLERCTTCCKKFHCPFCSSSLFNPTKLSKVKTHLESHFSRAVFQKEYTIHRCGLKCRPQLHYHCIHCQSTLSRKADFIKHVSLCKEKDSSVPHIPAKTNPTTPAPKPTTTPAPNTTTTPAPTTTTTPAPNTTTTPAPTTTTTPAPITTTIPARITTTTPAPITTTTPAPATITTPAPITTPTPAPATITTPAPITTPTPAPATITTPAPITTPTPAPITTTTPAPTTTTTPAPNTTTTPAPTTTTTPAPITTTIPARITTTTPAPITTTTPAPATITTPAPITTPTPAPITTTTPAPTTSTSSISATSTTVNVTTMPKTQVKSICAKHKCPKCQVVMNKKNLKRHLERKHTHQYKDITASSNLQSECIDPENGIYTVYKAFHGTSVPLHVQNKVWGENQHVSCESTECQVNMELAWRSGIKAYQCIHLKSITYCALYASSPVLNEETLTEMVNSKWFGDDKKKLCLDRQNKAKNSHVPLSVCSRIGTPQTKKYISIYEPTVSYYSRLGRVMVTYDTKKNSWHCPCARTKRSCPHKYVAKWHLFQTHRELFRKVRSTEEGKHLSTATEDKDSNDEAELGSQLYPPKDIQKLKDITMYIYKYKKLPAVLPEHLRLPSMEKEYPRHLIPEELMCQHCPGNVPLSDPVLITQKAKILTNLCIVQGSVVDIIQ